MNTPLASVEYLHAQLNDPQLIILDATQKLSPTEFKNNPDNIRIPNARYFNIKEVFSDLDSPFPNMLADRKQFEKNCRSLGIYNTSKIVVYDAVGIFSSPRVWWMFNTMGFETISVLDGGLPAWVDKGYDTEIIKDNLYPSGDFNAKFDSSAVQDITFIKENLDLASHIVIDARSEGRFKGTAPEPRKGIDSGCIPNSLNLPYSTLLENGKMKDKDSLKTIFNELNVQNEKLIFSCGSGITACILLLAKTIADGKQDYSVYDGSWTEWATIYPELIKQDSKA